jgi:RimJ/RimL family protein N-acetyltransferase
MQPAALARIAGPNLDLRLIEVSDAEYLYDLRTNPGYKRYLSAIRGSIEDQRSWLEAYKARERERLELYYVMERKDGIRCGVVRLYDIDRESFTWGSWILDHNKPPKAAVVSAMLSFGVGFECLGLHRAHVDVRVDNARAISFYRRLGMVEVDRTEQDLFFTYPRTAYEQDLEAFRSVMDEVRAE